MGDLTQPQTQGHRLLFLKKLVCRRRAIGGSECTARQPPLSLHSLTAQLSSTPRIPPPDKQIVLCSMGLLSPAAVPPPHLPTPQF